MSTVETIVTLDSPAICHDGSLAPRLALIAATVGAGLSAGLFYSYQVSVIRALRVVDDVTYVRSFQAINDKIQNPWFFASFMGTPPLIVAALALNRRAERAVKLLIGAGLVLNVAVLAITAAGNVPLNETLAAIQRASPEVATTARVGFEQPWNRLNLLRTLAQIGCSAALVGAASGRLGDR